MESSRFLTLKIFPQSAFFFWHDNWNGQYHAIHKMEFEIQRADKRCKSCMYICLTAVDYALHWIHTECYNCRRWLKFKVGYYKTCTKSNLSSSSCFLSQTQARSFSWTKHYKPFFIPDGFSRIHCTQSNRVIIMMWRKQLLQKLLPKYKWTMWNPGFGWD